MTNREKIADMKMVDFYAKYYNVDYGTFTRFIGESIDCNKCPAKPKLDNYCNCRERMNSWLDKEVSE